MAPTAFIAGNWKMHGTLAEATALAAALAAGLGEVAGREVVVAPPATALAAVGQAVAGSPIGLAGQNVAWEEKGAFTGEISPRMLRDLGCRYALVGHSERRHIFGETDALVNQRLTGALRHGLRPVFCIGETLAERESGATLTVLERQLMAGLKDVALPAPEALVVAYEPVWAIGTGRTATEEQAQEAHAFIRRILAQRFEKGVAAHIRIVYGGSVTPQNVDRLLAQPDLDGVLVGGASLKVESFLRIIHFQA
ncbi:MAG: triose-phosphate isomerase [Thermodesulfobacteriota bacterium]